MINKAKQLNKALKETSISKEYFALKDALENDEYITNLLKVIKQTQNEAKECLKNNDIENYKIKSKSLEILKDEFINHPLVNNYINVKNELNDLLEQVVSILSEE
ncbi:MAG: YlbF family regulator [Bacilli bacterium]|nr:YlbF family regulator [Bacilli bacterium]